MSIRGINAEIDRIRQLSERELQDQTAEHASWHEKYRDSAYLYIGNLDRGLTEGDLITVFSQFGEIVDINLVRDKETGKSKGFGFLAYEDQRSTRYAIDNMIGFNLVGRPLKVDHVNSYRAPIVEDPEGGTDAEGNPVYVDYKATGAEGMGLGVAGVTESQKMLDQLGKNRARVTAVRDKKWMVEDPEVARRNKKEKKHRHKKEESSKSADVEKSESSSSRRPVKEEEDDRDSRRHDRGSRDREYHRRERRESDVPTGGGGRGVVVGKGGGDERPTGLNQEPLAMPMNKKRSHPSAAPRKGSASSIDSSSSSSLSDGGQVDASSEDAFEAAFRFEDMTDDDFHGVRMMITRLLDGKEYDIGSLAQCIIDQQNIGTIIKSGEDDKKGKGDSGGDDAFCAVATILNPNKMVSPAGGSGGSCCGIMLNERMINLPSELVPGIHRVLKDDVAWSLSEAAHCPAEERKYYKFTHLLRSNCSCAFVKAASPLDLTFFFVQFLTSYYAAKRKKARLEMEKKERRYICFEDEVLHAGVPSVAGGLGSIEDSFRRITETYLRLLKGVFVDHALWQVSWPFPQGDGIDPETRKMLARKRLLYCVKYDDWKTMVDQLA
ncbi:hypothetical protein FOZ60_005825 [Perkinsus olseni]|uniref:RRM domain-containing protein n=1 Tax=Perkinsus olseni TaxID=32597 RepID=A0A7J6PGN5_PEROL|nr:hypothetical protein FOZ60_005825 [Perkinsus olseni]